LRFLKAIWSKKCKHLQTMYILHTLHIVRKLFVRNGDPSKRHLAVAQVPGAERLAAGEAGGALAVVGAVLHHNLLGVEHLGDNSEKFAWL
jgi:hypothetical protein